MSKVPPKLPPTLSQKQLQQARAALCEKLDVSTLCALSGEVYDTVTGILGNIFIGIQDLRDRGLLVGKPYLDIEKELSSQERLISAFYQSYLNRKCVSVTNINCTIQKFWINHYVFLRNASKLERYYRRLRRGIINDPDLQKNMKDFCKTWTWEEGCVKQGCTYIERAATTDEIRKGLGARCRYRDIKDSTRNALGDQVQNEEDEAEDTHFSLPP